MTRDCVRLFLRGGKGVHAPFRAETQSSTLSTFSLSLSPRHFSRFRVSRSLGFSPLAPGLDPHDVSFRILAFERVLGPVSVGVTIGRAKDTAPARLARSFIRWLVAARAFTKSVRVNGRSEIEASPVRYVGSLLASRTLRFFTAATSRIRAHRTHLCFPSPQTFKYTVFLRYFLTFFRNLLSQNRKSFVASFLITCGEFRNLASR